MGRVSDLHGKLFLDTNVVIHIVEGFEAGALALNEFTARLTPAGSPLS